MSRRTLPSTNRHSMVLAVVLTGLVSVSGGCENKPASTNQASAASGSGNKTSTGPAITPPAPKPDVNFASLDAAIAAFKQACVARDGDRINETMRWLHDQGNSALQPLGSIANGSSEEVGTRVAATRVVAMIGGEAATSIILKAAKSDSAPVRTKAAESLGSLRPATTPMVDQLIVLLDDNDHQVKASAIRSLRRIGPQAKRAAPKLQAMLNSNAEEEHRKEAHAALKKIAPRVGFRQGELEE